MQYQRQINQENIETTICHSRSLFRISYNDPRKDANSIQH
jgi:hypothetical protein